MRNDYCGEKYYNKLLNHATNVTVDHIILGYLHFCQLH